MPEDYSEEPTLLPAKHCLLQTTQIIIGASAEQPEIMIICPYVSKHHHPTTTSITLIYYL